MPTRVPRHLFVPEDERLYAGEDRPLSIGFGQTISQPSLVWQMTRALGLKPGDKVLEIGTGSGYQAALLAEAGAQVFSVERIRELADAADRRLQALGYKAQVRCGDGYQGWPEHAPYDAVIVTCAPEEVPSALAAQLKEGGRLVIPVGPQGDVQTLWRYVKKDGKLDGEELCGVVFVPMVPDALNP